MRKKKKIRKHTAVNLEHQTTDKRYYRKMKHLTVAFE